MRRYEDFSVITRDSLTYTLKIFGLAYNDGIFEKIMDKYVYLDLYPDAKDALLSLKNYKRAILSNGSTDMLTALVRNTGLDSILDATISIDAKGIFKPSPDAYSLIQARLDVNPGDVLFVSSNPWDAIGAKAVGLKVAWIERVTQEALADACRKRDLVVPLTMFKALRMQMDELDMAPGYKVNGLSALPDILPASKNS
jgi:2-haloacid dehalogenase